MSLQMQLSTRSSQRRSRAAASAASSATTRRAMRFLWLARIVSLRRLFLVARLRRFETLQALGEFGRVDRMDEGVERLRKLPGFADCQLALRDGGGDRLHRGPEVGGALERRQFEADRPLAARADDAAEAEPRHDAVAALGVLDRAAQQRARLAIKHFLGNYCGAVAGAWPLAGRITRLTLQKRPAARQPLRLLCRFLLHLQPICSKIHPHSLSSALSGAPIRIERN